MFFNQLPLSFFSASSLVLFLSAFRDFYSIPADILAFPS